MLSGRDREPSESSLAADAEGSRPHLQAANRLGSRMSAGLWHAPLLSWPLPAAAVLRDATWSRCGFAMPPFRRVVRGCVAGAPSGRRLRPAAALRAASSVTFLPFILPWMIRIRLCAVIVGVLLRVPFRREAVDQRLRHVEFGLADVRWPAGRRAAPRPPVRRAKRITDSTIASSMTSTAARCCVSRRMNFAMPTRPDSRMASRSSAYARSPPFAGVM